MRGERKKFAIQARKMVKDKDPKLNNTVMVETPTGNYTCCIAFSPDLVQFVGSKLPRGVADFDPAYLVVSEDPLLKVWVVAARYYRDEVTAILWKAKERPKWLKTLTNT